MRVLGIDPGLRRMGWGIIDAASGRISHIAHGVCVSTGSDLADRLLSLHRQLADVVQSYRPEAAAVEQTFVNKDGAGTLKLGQARAIALLVPAQAGISVGEYAPNKIKKTIVGAGHADKSQVLHMVRLQLGGIDVQGADEADALAIALCHAHHSGAESRLAQAISRAAS